MKDSMRCRMLVACTLICVAQLPLSAQVSADSTIEDRTFLGEWMAVSNAYMATLGDMRVLSEKLRFTKAGNTEFKVIKSGAGRYILKLGKEIAGGRYMKLGPIRKAKYQPDSVEVEVAFFASEADALLPEKVSADRVSSWGIYAKE